jgi:hypothetical protein
MVAAAEQAGSGRLEVAFIAVTAPIAIANTAAAAGATYCHRIGRARGGRHPADRLTGRCAIWARCLDIVVSICSEYYEQPLSKWGGPG